jgi:nucleotide-binding universal stress UspA family protein
MFKKILHANDGSEGAFRAFSVAVDLARQSKVELHSVSVEEISQCPETIEEVKAEKGAADRQFRNVLTGHPVVSILDVAKDLGADQLVIGTTGHYAMHEHMIGSRADRLVHLSLCPVLVVK